MVKAILNSSIEIVQNVGPEVKSRVPPTATAASNRPAALQASEKNKRRKSTKHGRKKTKHQLVGDFKPTVHISTLYIFGELRSV